MPFNDAASQSPPEALGGRPLRPPRFLQFPSLTVDKPMDNASGHSEDDLSANAAARHIEAQLGPPPRMLVGDFAAWATAEPPPWLSPDDEISRIYQHRKDTIARGVVRWAVVVQADNTIYRPGPIDSGAQVVFAPQGDVAVSDLARIARRIAGLKGTQPADPDERKLADMITDEYERALDWPIPLSLTNGLSVVTTIVILPRVDTPGGLLADNVFPILVDVRTSLVLFIPGRYWPPNLREPWEVRGAAMTGRMHAAREARQAALHDAIQRGDRAELGELGDDSLLVRLTDAAGQRLRELIVLQGKHACVFIGASLAPNGFRRYSMKFADRRSLGENHVSYTSRQVAIAIDVAHVELLVDVTLDFLSTPNRTGFKFDCPTDGETSDSASVPPATPREVAASPGKKCPGCGASLAEKAVLCVACGFDTRTGRRRVSELSCERSQHDVQLKITRKLKRPLTEPEQHVFAAWQRTIQPVIEDYLDEYAASSRLSGEVEITVTDFRCEAKNVLAKSLSRAVQLSISGRVADGRKTVQLSRSSYVTPATFQQLAIRSVFGLLTGDNTDEDMETIRSVVLGELDPGTLTSGTIARDPFYSSVSTQMIERLDALLGRDKVSTVRWWRFAKVVGVLIGVAIGYAAWVLLGNAPPMARLGFALLSLMGGWCISYAAGACLMPASFFENYGAGQRIMYLTGTDTGKNTLASLRVATFLAIAGMSAFVYSIWRLRGTD